MSLLDFDAQQRRTIRRLLNRSDRPHREDVLEDPAQSGDDNVWIKVTAETDPQVDPKTYKGFEVFEDGEETKDGDPPVDKYIFDSDESPSSADDTDQYFDDIEALPGAQGEIKVDGIYQLTYIEDQGTGEVTYYLVPQGGIGGGFEYLQITDADYSQDNVNNAIYRGTLVDNLQALPVGPVPEEDKFDIFVNDGYPWSLEVEDNLLIVDGSPDTIAYVNNTIAPDPVIKVENSGQVHVYNKEISGASLKLLIPSQYRIIGNPSLLTLSKYDDLFLIAQWSKKDNRVRIYIPVI